MTNKTVICNPLNLEYRYSLVKDKTHQSVSREAADPTMLLWEDTYLLFCSKTGGFWYSENLADWSFKETPELPIYDYAPDVNIVDGKVVFSASRMGRKCSFYESPNPLQEPFHVVSTPFAWWDPHLFQDEDKRVYFYWGCSAKNPIYGIEIDPQTMLPIGKKVPLVYGRPKEYGWERRGEHNIVTKPVAHVDKMLNLLWGDGPFIEGAYMTKVNGKYYLQYAAPGTEYDVYGDGVYVGEHPLGPFTRQSFNPVSSVPGGFMTGAGHGSTFRDKNGRWWHVATMRISVNEKFERRIGLFPCEFDSDGVMYCNQYLADYPFDVTTGEKTGWMQLAAMAVASSSLPQHGPELANDENVRTWWASDDKNSWLKLDLQEVKTVHAVQVNFADHNRCFPEELTTQEMEKEQMSYRKILIKPQQTEYLLEGSADGSSWEALKHAENKDFCHDIVILEKPKQLRYLRISEMKMPFNGMPALSGLRVFGIGNGRKPASVTAVTIQKTGPLNYLLAWPKDNEVQKYVVRWGLDRDKLYGSWLVKTNSLDFSFVTEGQKYFFAVDAVNENGITSGAVVTTE